MGNELRPLFRARSGIGQADAAYRPTETLADAQGAVCRRDRHLVGTLGRISRGDGPCYEAAAAVDAQARRQTRGTVAEGARAGVCRRHIQRNRIAIGSGLIPIAKKRGQRLRQEAWGRRKRCKKHLGNLS